MKSRPFIALSLILLFNTLVFSQSDSAVGFTDFIENQENEPDSVRFSSLAGYATKMNESQKFVDAGLASAEMMDMATNAQNEKWKARAFMTMGYTEMYQNNFTMAISNFQKAQVAFHNVADYRREIRAYQRIGGIYLHLRDVKLAQYYLLRALKIARERKLEDELAYLYTDFSTVEDINKNYVKALSYNEEAIEILKRMKIDYSSTLFNRGIILKNAGRYDESVETYEECLAFAKKAGDTYLEQMVYVNLPNTLIRMGQLDQAEMYANKSLEMAKSGKMLLPTSVEAYEALTSIYQKRGNFEKAFEYQKKWIMFRDSAFSAEKSRQLIETEAKYQTREKQLQIQQLDEENLNKRNQLLWLYGGVSLLALLLGLALWQYRAIRAGNQQLGKANDTLSDANQRISIQSAQLKELMQELHHRVKNNLAIVSSLLSLQADRLDDEKAIRAVMEGQQRVEAMSLIHNQLYQTDNVTGVSMLEYIGDLAKGLMQSFRYRENFSLKLDVEPIVLDVELAVPLGLIMNELVTNAFKHAYREISEPELSIRFWQNDKMYLEIRDNGPGVDPEKWQKGGTSFGKRLIKSLTKQAKGTLEIRSENGACFLLTFPPVKLPVLTEPEYA